MRRPPERKVVRSPAGKRSLWMGLKAEAADGHTPNCRCMSDDENMR